MLAQGQGVHGQALPEERMHPILVLFVQATIICILMSFRLERDDQHLSRGHSGDDLANLLQCTVG